MICDFINCENTTLFRTYCHLHRCHKKGCYKIVNTHQGGFALIIFNTHCQNHECHQTDCTLGAHGNSLYFINHKCYNKKCKSPKLVGSFCEYHHKCEFDDCDKQTANVYCRMHKCNECDSRIENGKSLCTKCIMNMTSK